MMAYPGQTLTTLGQLCATISRPVVKEPGIELGSVVTPIALRCSVLDCCATREEWELLQDCWKSIPGEAGWEIVQRVVTLKNLKYKIFFDLF